MSASTPPPDEEALRQFVLGNLSPERTGEVITWLVEHPSPDLFSKHAASDPLAAGLVAAAAAEAAPPLAVEKIIQFVRNQLRVKDLSVPHGLPRTTALAHSPGDTTHSGADSVALAGISNDFELLSEIGRGGMGVVYKARQVKLNRLVALKTMLDSGPISRNHLIRFLAEAESVAAIKHVNVVQVHEYGERDGRPYMALEFLPGGTLADHLASFESPESVGALVAKIARGVAAAHALGIVHRDLKPGNVLFDEAREPKVADFGLAKRAGGSDLTATQAVMGTPAYMSPEQADGKTKFVGPETDVWALGVILYECLTGNRPFVAENLKGLLTSILVTDPLPPRKRNPAVPRDLECICLKCLSKPPYERYPTGKELADDLDRFVRGEPIHVRPAGLFERTYKWARRKPALATAWGLGAFSVLLGIVVAGALWLWQGAEVAKTDAVTTRDQLAIQKQETEKALEGETAARKREASANEQLAIANDKLGAAADLRNVDSAYRELRAGNVLAARDRLAECRPEFRSFWEWRFVAHSANSETIVLQDRPKGRMIRSLAVSPDGRRVATTAEGGEPDAHLWDIETGRCIGPPPLVAAGNPQRTVNCVAFNPDGSLLAGGCGGVVAVWDAATGAVKTRFVTPPTPNGGVPARVFGVAFVNGGKTVVAGNEDGAITVWDLKSGQRTTTIPATAGASFGDLTASADGTRLAVLWQTRKPGGLRVFDTQTWDEVFTITPPQGISINGVRLNQDGSLAAVRMAIVNVTIWDTKAKTEVSRFQSKIRIDEVGAFTQDGSAVAVASGDDSISLFDPNSGKQTGSLRGHTGRVGGIATGGSVIVTGGEDGTVRVWRSTASALESLLTTKGILPVDFTRDSHGILLVGPTGITIRAAASGKEIATLPRASIPGGLERRNVALAPDGVRVAIVYMDAQLATNLVVWNSTTGAVATSEPVKRVFPHGVCWSGDGQQVVVLGQSGDTRADHWLTILFDPSAALVGKPVYTRDRPLGTHAKQDGPNIFSWTRTRGLVASDVSGKLMLKFDASDSSEPLCMAISPDGLRVVAVCDDRTLRIWDGASGVLQTSFGVGGPKATAIALSPDSARVVIGHADGSVKLWDLSTGLPSIALPPHGSGVAAMQFSPDGHWLITTDDKGNHQIHDAGQPPVR